jgi:hypothetical protein
MEQGKMRDNAMRASDEGAIMRASGERPEIEQTERELLGWVDGSSKWI